MNIGFIRTALAAFSLTIGMAHAALHDRGGGLIYDDVLNITWLQDANYAKTSGYDDDGLMTWEKAMAWAANLSYYDSVRNVTYSDWRLPRVNPINGIAFNFNLSTTGATDRGYNISAPGSTYAGYSGSEMAYMYYNNLGNKGYYAPIGIVHQAVYGLTNTGPFTNLKSYVYWSGLEYAPGTVLAWLFYTLDGAQLPQYLTDVNFAWAVRPGDVAVPIPEPETYALMLAGLALVGVAARLRRA